MVQQSEEYDSGKQTGKKRNDQVHYILSYFFQTNPNFLSQPKPNTCIIVHN